MWEYGLSTEVVGRVVEAVTGTSLGQFLDERVFRPLGMTDTTFHVPADKVTRLAQPFATDCETGKPITLHDVTVAPKHDAGGAGAASTAMDYARFLHMLANGGQLDGQRLLARTIVRHMTSDHLGDIKPATPQFALGYGFGLGFAIRRADGLNGAPGSAGEYTWGRSGGHVVLGRSESTVGRHPHDPSAARAVAARVPQAVPTARLPSDRRLSKHTRLRNGTMSA